MTTREKLLRRYVARDYRIRMRDDSRPVVATATIGSVDGEILVWVDKITEGNGLVRQFLDLPSGLRRRVVKDLIRADCLVRNIGDTTCGHGRYLLDEFCSACIREASPNP